MRGTRILPDAIVNSYDAGESLELIHENYPGLSVAQIQRLIEFAHAQSDSRYRERTASFRKQPRMTQYGRRTLADFSVLMLKKPVEG